MPFQARQVVEEFHAQAAAAEQALLTLAAPALAPAFPGGFAPLPGAAAPRRPRPAPGPDWDGDWGGDWGGDWEPEAEAAPEGEADRAAILAEIRALTEELERRNRRAEERRPRGPFGALSAAGRRWL